MISVVTPEQMKKIDAYMIHEMQIPGILLMENAAMHVSEAASKVCGSDDEILVVCGTGNNGGDGFAAARQLMAMDHDVFVVLLGNSENLTPDARTNFKFISLTGRYAEISTQEELDNVFDEHEFSPVIIDAIFGTGLSREVTGIYAFAIEEINHRAAHGSYVISVDIPSGVDGLTGAICGTAIEANETVTFQYPKPGHFLYPGAENTGKLNVFRIGVDEGCKIIDGNMLKVAENDDKSIIIEERSRNSNKGDYGTVTVFGGSCGMSGAAVLSAKSAIAVGAGKTKIASCAFTVAAAQACLPEAMAVKIGTNPDYIDASASKKAEDIARLSTAVVIGPGMDTNDGTAEVIKTLMRTPVAKVIDADALNLIASNPEIFAMRRGDIVLTPHPGEMSRLTGVPTEEILADQVKYAVNYAFKWGVTVVLKSASTVVADSSGMAVIIPQGSAGMAKGGSGDVLSGIIAGLIAQDYDAFDAAVAGAYINGTAGEMAAEKHGVFSMKPSDTIDEIGTVLTGMAVKIHDCPDEEPEIFASDPVATEKINKNIESFKTTAETSVHENDPKARVFRKIEAPKFE